MIFEITTGKLYDGPVLVGQGWAGHLTGNDNPSMEDIKNVGPLPEGSYTIGDPLDGTSLGPLAFPLTPAITNKEYGRSDFFIHGAALTHPEMSSDGCIIQPHVARIYVAAKIKGTPFPESPFRQLQVVAKVS